MIWESVKGEEEIEEVKKLSFAVLMLQGIATSIDALSVGFTIADYGFVMALVCSIIIAVVTFAICETGLYLEDIRNKAGRKSRCLRWSDSGWYRNRDICERRIFLGKGEADIHHHIPA